MENPISAYGNVKKFELVDGLSIPSTTYFVITITILIPLQQHSAKSTTPTFPHQFMLKYPQFLFKISQPRANYDQHANRI